MTLLTQYASAKFGNQMYAGVQILNGNQAWLKETLALRCFDQNTNHNCWQGAVAAVLQELFRKERVITHISYLDQNGETLMFKRTADVYQTLLQIKDD
ncbi:hypothetical protein FACS1894103_5720 [Campylobacterota bacterium]|nr:hypothetical protein FACS1894103_5720 [Campylobacterota bacterium]